jgi:hypothetical protein
LAGIARTGFRSIIDKISLWMGVVTGPDSIRPVPAVCISPGTRLMLRDIPERLQSVLCVRRVEEVTFRQLSADSFSYRDAVHFRNGHVLKLQQLQKVSAFEF